MEDVKALEMKGISKSFGGVHAYQCPLQRLSRQGQRPDG